jgi:mitotic spindle assembly checkpoint protein MAD2
VLLHVVAVVTTSVNTITPSANFDGDLLVLKASPPQQKLFNKVNPKMSQRTEKKEKDPSKVHKLSLRGSSKIVSEFFEYSINTILFQRGVYPAEDFSAVKKYGLNMLVSSDDQVKAYIKKIMGQLKKWMEGSKISKLVVVITSKETGEHIERWQFDVCWPFIKEQKKNEC